MNTYKATGALYYKPQQYRIYFRVFTHISESDTKSHSLQK